MSDAGTGYAQPSRPDMAISLVIPAWNEEAFLPKLLDTVEIAREKYRGGRESVEVIVADNASTDATAEIAQDRGCRVVHVAKRCIAAARNGGAAAARGGLLAFADADFEIHPETFNYIALVMATPGHVGGATGLLPARWSAGIAVTWCLVLPPLWLAGFDGGVWFCRRADFEAVGGFDERVFAGEDVRFLTALRRLGRKRRPRERLVTRFTARKLGLAPPLVINSCRKFDQRGDWHLLTHSLKGLFYLAFARRKADDLIRQYWYEDRNRP